MNFLGLQRFDHILKNPEMLDILEKNMNFTLPDFYKNLKVRNFGIPNEVEEKEAYIKRLEEDIMNSISTIHNLEMQIEMQKREIAESENKWKALIDSYESSNSWKITKPLRDAGSFLKNKSKK